MIIKFDKFFFLSKSKKKEKSFDNLSFRKIRGLRLHSHDLRSSSSHANNNLPRSASLSTLNHPPHVVFSGIQPSGIPHIGNYFGALKKWVELSKENKLKKKSEGKPNTTTSELYFSIVGLHAITLPREAAKLRREKLEMMCVLLALGLNPDECCLFNQDEVPAHAEMAWILNCIAPVGRLSRMTTWKSQIASSVNANSISEVDDSMLHLGLLAYPVLQSADILLYKSTHVPVGEDQTQHLELTKALAKSLNHQFNEPFFPIPNSIFTPHSKILNLRNPTMKMSKSTPGEMTRIMITDDEEKITKKIKGAVTDSDEGIGYDPAKRAGLSNLISIYQSISKENVDEITKKYQNSSILNFKLDLIQLLVSHFQPFQAEFRRLLNHPDDVQNVFHIGAQKASLVANHTLHHVKTKLGLI